MAVEFDVTVGGEDSNTYVSIAYADQYFENIGGTAYSNWSAIVDDEDKKRALIRGTQFIDTYPTYNGTKVSIGQRLEFPRVLVGYDIPSGSDSTPYYIPEKIMEATMEATRRSISEVVSGVPVFEDLIPDRTREVMREKVGELETWYDRDSPVYDQSFTQIETILRDYIESYGAARVFKVRRA